MRQIDPTDVIIFDPSTSLDERDAAPRGIVGVKIVALQRFAEPLALKDLAEAARMPSNTLTRYFNRTFGISPMRWLWAFRTLLASEIIACSPSWSLTDVATHCGFNSSAHFSRRYRELFQETPSRHRLDARTQGVAPIDHDKIPKFGNAQIDADPLLGQHLELVLRAMDRLDAMAHKFPGGPCVDREPASTESVDLT